MRNKRNHSSSSINVLKILEFSYFLSSFPCFFSFFLWEQQHLSSVFCCPSVSDILFLICQFLESPGISRLFSNTHSASVITQPTVGLVPQPAEFQTGLFDKSQSYRLLSPSPWILTNPAAAPSIVHQPTTARRISLGNEQRWGAQSLHKKKIPLVCSQQA